MGWMAEPASLSQYAGARCFTCSRTYNTHTIRITTGGLFKHIQNQCCGSKCGTLNLGIQDFGPIWIKIRIHGYVINFEKEKRKIVSYKKIFLNILCLRNYKKNNGSWRNFVSVGSLNTVNGEFLSSILHHLSLIYPNFTCVDPDPYSDDGSGPTKLLNTGSGSKTLHVSGTNLCFQRVATYC